MNQFSLWPMEFPSCDAFYDRSVVSVQLTIILGSIQVLMDFIAHYCLMDFTINNLPFLFTAY